MIAEVNNWVQEVQKKAYDMSRHVFSNKLPH